MATLLGLPRELRDQIIGLVLLSPPLVSPNVRRKRSLMPGENHPGPFVRQMDIGIYHLMADAMHQPTALSLLLVNYQFYKETSEFLKRAQPTYKLHLTIVVDHMCVWPTWHFIPTNPHAWLDQVEVEILECYSISPRPSSLVDRETWKRRYKLCIDAALAYFFRYHWRSPHVDRKPRGTKRLLVNFVTREFARDDIIPHSAIPGQIVEYESGGCQGFVSDGSASPWQLYAMGGPARVFVDHTWHLKPPHYPNGTVFRPIRSRVAESCGEITVARNGQTMQTCHPGTWYESSPTDTEREAKRKAVIRKYREGLGL